jgi:hypothetical protein
LNQKGDAEACPAKFLYGLFRGMLQPNAVTLDHLRKVKAILQLKLQPRRLVTETAIVFAPRSMNGKDLPS